MKDLFEVESQAAKHDHEIFIKLLKCLVIVSMLIVNLRSLLPIGCVNQVEFNLCLRA